MREFIVKNELSTSKLSEYKYIRLMLIISFITLMCGEAFSKQGMHVLLSGITWLCFISIVFYFSKTAINGTTEFYSKHLKQ